MKTHARILIQKLIPVLTLLVFTAGLLAGAATHARAQSNGWAKAVNLSNMGSASNPAVVADDAGKIHAFWYDEFVGVMYSSSPDGTEWSKPVGLALPFGESQVTFIQGPENTIHAFWIDRQGMLMTSAVNAGQAEITSAWRSARILARTVSSFQVVKDAGGTMHIVFVRNDSVAAGKAGVYYLKSTKGAIDWSPNETMLYASPYFRGGEPDGENVSVAAYVEGETTAVFASWDEQAVSKVFLSRSLDGGATWGEPVEIDRPESQFSFAVPQKIKVYSWNDQTLLLWEKGGETGSCSHIFQVSKDQGETWSSADAILPDTAVCSTASGVVASTPEMFVYSLTINGQVSFIAWDGSTWSEPQLENGMMYIQDPETTQQISFGCQQTAFQPAANLVSVVGCDLSSRKDIWYTSLVLGDLSNWFLSKTVWQRPSTIFDIQAEVSSTQLLSDSQGNFYALWIQKDVPNRANPQGQTLQRIYFAGRVDNSWFAPSPVLRSQQGDVDLMAAALTSNETLLTVWWGEQDRALYFSRAPLERAFIQGEWLEPVVLPASAGNYASVDIAVGPSGAIFVVYSVAFNEERGVYLARSDDGGKTWDSPVLIFNGQAAAWDRVGDASVSVSTRGTLHVIWRRQLISSPEAGLGLYYARSEDGGETWSQAQTVLDGGVLWGGLVETSTGQLYRVWQTPSDQQIVIGSQISADDGITWSPPLTVLNTAEALLPFQLLADQSGRVHLLQLTKNSSGLVFLMHWITGETAWESGDGVPVSDSGNMQAESMAGAFSTQGKMGALFSLIPHVADMSSASSVMQFTERKIEDSAAPPLAALDGQTPAPMEETPTPTEEAPTPEPEALPAEPLPSPTPNFQASPTSTVQASSTPAFQASPTPTLVDFNEKPSSASDSPWGGAVAGVVIATLIIVTVFGISIAYKRKLFTFAYKNKN